MHLLAKWLIMTCSIIIASYLIPGVRVGGFFSALWVALFMGLVNLLVRPLLIIITLPVTILTLGLFTLVINAFLILLASAVLKGFDVSGFWVALLFGVVLSIINHLLGYLFGV
jgi:putative membrane protein